MPRCRFLKFFLAAALWIPCMLPASAEGAWVRINQLGYLPDATKVAVLLSREAVQVTGFELADCFTDEVVFRGTGDDIRPTGPLGGMQSTARLDFSGLRREGAYRIRVFTRSGDSGSVTESDIFPVNHRVYDGTADFVLNYMRQQRCGWNPFLRDSCHTKDAIIVGHPDPAKDSTRLDVHGGWHDASDCLQYTATSANAIYQMLFAFQRNPEAFPDNYRADGTAGRNGISDIVDEIRWGLEWLDRMNPAPGELYNQIADDRDHVGMRPPPDDQADYGWGVGQERPVWFCSGEPQQRGREGGKNATTGVASTAGKFASAFSLGAEVLKPYDPAFAAKIGAKAEAAYQAGRDKPGVCQTASVRSPYIYEEDNWTDDMELAAIELFRATGDPRYQAEALAYARREPVTPWMGADSAYHYQWYPFLNMGHYYLAREGNARVSQEFVRNLRSGIRRTYEKAQGHPFLYGIPAIWCSNNLTTAMLTQCILYRQLTGDTTYQEMEGSLRDWLFGCNPWGVSMVVELPRGGTYPTQPHSFIINYNLGNTTGGLVDGPVYTTIFNSLLGVNTEGGINYEEFQPGDMVYHDSTHDYSTNEPTMDGTASLTFPLSAYEAEGRAASARPATPDRNVYREGGIIRTDPSVRHIDFVFTAADKADGADRILATLEKFNVRGGFFFTGEFFEKFPEVVKRLVEAGHYVGSHSYDHLLYASWNKRDSLLVTREQFQEDLLKSYRLLRAAGVQEAPYFLPPYEHYNATVASWARQMGLRLVNCTPGTYTNGDYTTPDMEPYYSSRFILDKIREYERTHPDGLNGHILLIHLGTDPARTDKFYDRLPQLIRELRRKGYSFTPLH